MAGDATVSLAVHTAEGTNNLPRMREDGAAKNDNDNKGSGPDVGHDTPVGPADSLPQKQTEGEPIITRELEVRTAEQSSDTRRSTLSPQIIPTSSCTTAKTHGDSTVESPTESVIASSPAGIDEVMGENTDTALYLAAQYGRLEIAKALLAKGADVNTKNDDGQTSLTCAVFSESKEMVRLILDAPGVDVGAQDLSGQTALFHACWIESKEMVTVLLDDERGLATIDISDEEAWTPLHAASQYGATEIINLLLGKQANAKLKDSEGWTALHFASLSGKKDAIETLLKYNAGIEIDAKDYEGRTALHIASRYGYLTVVQFLLKKDANPVITTINNETALQLAGRRGHGEVIQILSRALDKRREPTLVQLASLEDINSFECILNNFNWTGLDRAVIKDEAMLIWNASRKNHHDDARRLLESTADRKIIDLYPEPERKQWKALRWAACLGNHTVTWWLLVSGLSKEMDNERREALKLAREVRKQASKNEEHTQSVPEGSSGKRDGDPNIETKKEKKRKSLSSKGFKISEKEVAEKSRDMESKRDKYDLTIDILQDPPLMQGWSEHPVSYKLLEPNENCKKVTEKFDATIIDFYRRKEGKEEERETDEGADERVDFLRRSRTVYDVIYKRSDATDSEKGGGPAHIMKDARLTIEKIGSHSKVGKYLSYKEDDLQVRWVHLPANNMEWMTHLAQRIYHDGKKPLEEYRALDEFVRQSWHELPGSKPKLNYMQATCRRDNVPLKREPKKSVLKKASQGVEKPSDPSAQDQTAIYLPTLMDDQGKSEDTGPHVDPRIALYMPYLTFATYKKCQTENSEKNDMLFEAYKVNKVTGGYKDERKDKDDHHKDTDEQKVMDEQKDTNEQKDTDEQKRKDNNTDDDKNEWRIVHRSRTLDQFYYHSLEDTSERDSTQVVTRYPELRDKMGESKWEILRVDQLWLWVIDSKTIITSSTNRLDDREDPVIEGIYDLLRETKGKRNGRPPPSSVGKMSEFITNFCIELIDKSTLQCKSGELSARQIFANSINNAANEESKLFEAFEKKIEGKLKKIQDDDPVAKDQEKDGDPGAKDQKKDSKPGASDQEKDYASISKAAHLLKEVKDIRDELSILSYLLTQQRIVWKKLRGLPINNDGSINNQALASREEIDGMKGPALAINDVHELNGIAQRIQDSVNSVLALEQNEANLSEAVSAGMQSKETIEQGRTLMVFTVITIIFLPMSFLTSLFALNVRSFPHQDGNVVYRSGFIFPIIFGVTAAISIPTIVYALLQDKHKLNWNRSLRKPSSKTPLPESTKAMEQIVPKPEQHTEQHHHRQTYIQCILRRLLGNSGEALNPA